MIRIRILLAWLVLAALPLQGFAAASMLFCGAGPAHRAQQHLHGEFAPAHHHDDGDDHDQGHGHSAAGPDHAQAHQGGPGADDGAQLPDSSHTCGACAACCHSAAMASTPLLPVLAQLPQVAAAEPFVLIHPQPSKGPDKPPRI